MFPSELYGFVSTFQFEMSHEFAKFITIITAVTIFMKLVCIKKLMKK